jgi:hypothetical protein
MPRPTFLVLVLLALWLLPACRTVPNAAYCEDNAECEQRLGPGSTCNTERNSCLPPPGAGCSDDDECTLANEPICDLTLGEPACRRCNVNLECETKNGETPFCSPDGACIDMMPPQCVDSGGCATTPETPICDTDVGMCKPCNEVDAQDACEALQEGVPYCAGDGDNAGSCVQCLDETHCSSGKPVCDQAANTCVGCTEHAQCAEYSGVCGGEACVAEDDVIYVVKGAMDTKTCSRSTPCGNLTDALELVTATRRFIVIEDETPGIYAEHLALAPPTGNVTIIGNNATILGTDNKATIDVSGGAIVALEGLTVDHANTGSLAEGVHCQDSTVSIESSIVRDAAGIGVSVNGCSLTIERSIITANLSGGIVITDSSFSIINTFITGNGKDTGTPTSNLGGVRIDNLNEKEPQFFAFNTVAENRGGLGATASGVECSVNPLSTVAVTSSIIRKGAGGRPTLAGDCVWRNSNVEDGASVSALAPADMDNNYLDCALADDGTGVFRIDTGSPCDNAGQPNTGVLVDYEGKARSAMTPDMGADELDANPAPAEHAN